MIRRYFLIAIFLVLPSGTYALDGAQAMAFLQCLLDDPESANGFVHEEDQHIVGRLGICYSEAPCKALISWGLDGRQVDQLRQRGISGQFTVDMIDEHTSQLVLFPDDSTLTRPWFFRDDKLISSILHLTREWNRVDSPHFRFFISDNHYFHPANVTLLEDYLLDTATQLALSPDDMNCLAKEKIYYCFCRDQQEIKQLTGYFARGIYIVSHDIIVSTYSSHLHELAHLLMNFKQKQPHLYTHPFFLEGFAVALGGRGGKMPDILHQLGLFLHRTSWITLEELVDANEFRQLNETMSYPASGCYNRFLLKHLGIADCLRLYSRYGGGEQTVKEMSILAEDLPSTDEWHRYLETEPREGPITPELLENGEVLCNLDDFTILADSLAYGFTVPDIALVPTKAAPGGYRSHLFEQLISGHAYRGERYLVRTSSEEAGIYDLFTNMMIAHYAAAFSEQSELVPAMDNRHAFQVLRHVFPVGLCDR
jgi:hypothetical protein